MLKIWGRANSANVEKVLWCALELGLPFERIDAGGAFGVVDTPEFRTLNPVGLVPVIEDDGFVLWESNSIVRYLATTRGAGTLALADPRVRAEAERWMDYQLGTLAALLRPVFWGLVRTPPEQRDPAAIGRGVEALGKALAVVDGALASRPFLAGDSFTMGDIPVGCVAHRWFNVPAERPALPHLERWYRTLRARPAAAQAMVLPLT